MPEQKQFRWELSDMSPGASLVTRVAFPPAPKEADISQGAKVGAHWSVLLQAAVSASVLMSVFCLHDEAMRPLHACNASQEDKLHASCLEAVAPWCGALLNVTEV